MRVTITKLMDKGLKRTARAQPDSGDLRQVEESGRRTFVLSEVHATAIPVIAKLVHPQIADVGERSWTVHGYELDRKTGQLFAQAWEIEPQRR